MSEPQLRALVRSRLKTRQLSLLIHLDEQRCVLRAAESAGMTQPAASKLLRDIEAAVDAVIAANPQKVEEVKLKPKLAAWFVGQVMKQTGGKANPAAVNAALKTRLNLPDEG